ncbi:cytochrome d ubiquinol oxidase subunit II [Microlunatus soli]|uniref:Cytochrome bd-I ubiquinol oxidase subunit 2 apoprotein n=1 Tax=Microlunatus soli TaxID=630515 RepID=A0A1H1UY72_9ACTN|nr:cytochrome d ubiquinol oxidase subunit II [Microlunatus soli]SDS77472.1 cytochrome bd-I ubiquinol oxidase subunit 2 apoprotein [Microlunatus soli]
MELTTLWFGVVTFFWLGYFVLEGFDFGVGMWQTLLGREERDRRAIISTIGPVWDGNEVWVIVAGGAMFAAFPGWYATTFSAFYLPLLAILVALIIRVVAFEYRDHHDDPRWRRRWDTCMLIGSALPAFLWGLVFGNIVAGLPLNSNGDYTGSPLGLLNPFAVLIGVTTLSLFLTHGGVFLALRTTGELRLRAKRAAGVSGMFSAVLGIAALLWLNLLPTTGNRPVVLALSVIAVVALVFALVMHRADRDGWSFAGTALTVAAVVLSLFAALFPRLLPSSTDPRWTLTITNAAAGDYSLTIMSWSALVLIPLVIGYQAWTYWVFRKRVVVEPAPENAGAR